METEYETDHSAVICTIDYLVPRSREETHFTKTILDHDSIALRLSELACDHSWLDDDGDVAGERLVNKISSIVSENTATRVIRASSQKYDCPWLDSGLLRLIRKKDNLRRRVKQCPNNLGLRRNYDSLSHLINERKSRAKKTYYTNMFNSCSSTKQTWKQMNSVLGRSKQSESIEYVTNKNGEKISGTQAPRCSLIRETDAEEVAKLIADLDPTKAPGADGISNSFLKRHKEVMAELISLLFNEVCVRKKIFPRSFKLAKVIPIPKTGSTDKSANGLRPILLLSAIAKILEKLIYRRIMDHFNATQFLYSQQYGFREKSSTTVACLETINDLQKSCDLTKSPAILSIDLSAAFDTVDHSILLGKYRYAGISDGFLELLRSYLTDRHQFIQVGEWRSESRAITIGTPQGSCLSTLNYLVYVNDIGNLRLNGRLRAFADDKSITYENYNAELIQADIGLLSEYFRINLLTANLNKTSVMILNSSSLASTAPLTYNGTEIKRVEVMKYLGLYIDNKLSFSYHVDQLARQLASIVGVMYRVRSFLPNSALMTVYNGIVHSKLTYLISSYGSANKGTMDRIFTLQKRALKIALNLPLRFGTEDLFTTKPKTLPLPALYLRSLGLLTYQFIHDLTLHNIELTPPPQNRSTRSTGTGRLLPRKSNSVRFGDACFEYTAPSFYNQLSQELKNAQSFLIFKNRLTNHLRTPKAIAKVLNQ